MGKKKDETTAPAAPAIEGPVPPSEGGSYVIENGVGRRLEEATKNDPRGNMNRDADGRAVDHQGRAVAVKE